MYLFQYVKLITSTQVLYFFLTVNVMLTSYWDGAGSPYINRLSAILDPSQTTLHNTRDVLCDGYNMVRGRSKMMF